MVGEGQSQQSQAGTMRMVLTTTPAIPPTPAATEDQGARPGGEQSSLEQWVRVRRTLCGVMLARAGWDCWRALKPCGGRGMN